jgi:hypothetical protein
MRTLKEECLWLTEWTCPFVLITALEAWIDDDNAHDLHLARLYPFMPHNKESQSSGSAVCKGFPPRRLLPVTCKNV